nr:type I polyketide synthase [Streptomyces sp. NRRL WC-3742]
MSNNESGLREYLRRATAELRDVNRRMREMEERQQEPIAIVGMACRFPGGVASPEDLWRLVADGRDGVSPFPTDRGWDLDTLFDDDLEKAGTSYCREAGFLHDAGQFDPAFFGISPREAVAVDPQQRLLLETSWEAIEHAGLDPRALHGSRTGVFAGVMYHDYQPPVAAVPEELEGMVGTGSAGSIASGRIAYTLGLEGPAVTVDTACSSSLVALHLAAHALRQGECELALAGGVTVMATPSSFVEFSRQRGLAPDGRCKSFSSSADGTSWAEGVGVLVLERLSVAQAKGHRVLAVVRGSAINQDGASNGLTAPNGPSQERVIRQALAQAGLVSADVDAVEAHGTGTALGDPIEAQALLATYGQEREEPLWLGSLKSNIGHSQAAAGVGGVIKMVMAMRHGVLPQTLNVDEPTRHVDWSAGAVELLTERRDWPAVDRPRRAAVSSFGISGTNAHVILEQAEATEPAEVEAATETPAGVVPLLISAASPEALRGQAARLAAFLEQRPEAEPAAVAAALLRRTAFGHRAMVVGSETGELVDGLGSLVVGEAVSDAPKVGVLFTGQGAQRAGMGRELCAAFPVFEAAFEEVCAAFDPLLGRSLRDLCFEASDSDELDRTQYTQPALFAFEVAAYRLLESHGLRAAALIGHSIGELAAAHVAGVFSLADAARLVAARGRLMQELPTGGAMIAVQATEADVLPLLVGHGDKAAVAAVNAPTSVVISGEDATVTAVAERLAASGRKSQRLRVSHAFHSPLMDPMLDEFRTVAASVTYHEPTIPVVSNVTGTMATSAQLTDPEYWVRHVREAVRFTDGLTTAHAQGITTYVETGPDAILTALTRQILADHPQATATPLARRNRDEARTALEALGTLWTRGARIDWTPLLPAQAAPVDLPTYAFDHQHYWIKPQATTGGLTTAGRLSLTTHPWLADHTVHGTPLLPGTAFVELALQAAHRTDTTHLHELTLQAPLVLTEQGARQLQVTVSEPEGTGHRAVTIHSRPADGESEEPWTLHADGLLAGRDVPPAQEFTAWPPAGAQPIAVDGLYDRLADLGLGYGPLFQGVTAAWSLDGEILAAIELPEQTHADAARFGLHPALLDSALHTLALSGGEEDSETRLPFSWSGVTLWSAGATALRVRVAGTDGPSVRLQVADGAGTPVLSVDALVLRPVTAGQLSGGASGALLGVEWVELPVPAADQAPRLAALRTSTLGVDAYEDLDALAASGPLPEVVLTEVRKGEGPEAVRTVAREVLALAQEWLAEERFAGCRLAVVTRGAAATDSPDPALAAARGLIRAAQVEHPDRFVLLDTDEESLPLLPAALATDETELALHSGTLSAPRLVRLRETAAAVALDGTVLITGGTSGLGALAARHLVATHGVRHLVLASRRGIDAPGVAELRDELAALGASVTVAACDVSDRDALAALLATVPAEHPLTAVVHAAGTLADAPVTALTEAQLDHVLAPKAEAARHLHELTRELPLTAFVLLSSLAGTWGNAGQANYAAANAYLDALAAARRAEGLPGTAVAYGLWDTRTGLSEALTDADLERMRRQGLRPLTVEQGLAALDAALGTDRPLIVSTGLALRALADQDRVRPLLRRLVTNRVTGGPLRRASAGGARTGSPLYEQLIGLDEPGRQAFLVDVVRGQVAAVLGFAGPEAVHADRLFQELGFDSLTALELRNLLNQATGLVLPATLVFDYPTPTALARHLATALLGTAAAVSVARTVGADEDPIAIVGMACRFPGGVGSPEDLWRLVANGRDGITGFPTDRSWDLDGLFDDDPERAGTSYCREAGFLHGAGEFDAPFFGISPREAVAIDPQQRLLLETSWEAIERAGLDPRGLHGSRTGVFAGVMYHDYQPAVGAVPEELEGMVGTGSLGSVASGRIAYTLGLEGPALTVDTACSSSLVALHLAAQALRQGECDLALAGGVTVMATPAAFVEFSRQRGLAPDGRCKSFSTGADGTSWAEGVGMLVLERLSDAQRNGHRVLAVVRGSAINQDGASNGLTAPNGPSQERVIRQALAQAGLVSADVDAVEAHGTGTALGDPIEAQALLATYGQEREEPLWLGSLKSNIGHSQAAAGVGGVIKMVMAMRHGVLPQTLNVDEPTTHVDWSAGAVELLTSRRDWPEVDRPRRAAVSSFGISGTNAHVILEQPESVEEPETSTGLVPLLVSAASPDALRAQAARLAAHLEEQQGELGAGAVAAALLRRTVFDHRAVVVGGETDELAAGLASLANEPGGVGGAFAPPKVGVLFTGQGAQRAGMGRELCAAFPVFEAAFEEVCAAFDPLLGRSLRELCFEASDSDELDRTQYTQPALFAFEVAAYRLLESHGLRAAALIGHSIGELAAAHIAGVFSLADAARLVAARGRLMQELPEGGAMIAVQATEADVLPLLAGHEHTAAIAAVNAPTSVVISGQDATVTAVAEQLAASGRRSQRLRVSHAFHSPLMDPMLDEFREIAESIAYQEPTIPVVSNVTGTMATSGQLTDPEYWVSHVREAVRFTDGLTTAHAQGITTYVETGPDATLTALTRQTLADEEQLTVAPVTRRNRDEARTTLEALGTLWSRGAAIDWSPLVPATATPAVDLPTYAFDHQHYWIKPLPAPGGLTTAGLHTLDHPLLGAVTRVAGTEQLILSGRLSLTTHPWLADHTVHGATVVPGAALVELVLQAALRTGSGRVGELVLQAPLVLAEQGARQLQVTVSEPDETGHRAVAVHSRPEESADSTEPWTLHAEGHLSPTADRAPGDLTAWPPAGAEAADPGELYARLAALGLDYGPAFQGLRAAWQTEDALYAEVELPEDVRAEADRYALHPALLDAALHTLAVDQHTRTSDGQAQTLLPFTWSGLTLHAHAATALRVRITTEGPHEASLHLADTTGAPVLTLDALALRPLAADRLTAATASTADVSFHVEWTPVAIGEAEPGPYTVVEITAAPAEAEDPLRDTLRRALAAVQEHLADPEAPRLVLLTRGAVATAAPDPVQAAVRGLVRSAQAEHPDRFVLVDADEKSLPLLPAALATGEPALALHEGAVSAPRLVRHTPAPTSTSTPSSELPSPELPSLDGTVLITGGTTGLGALIARHLVTAHGARSLLLTSRRGSEAPGASELALDLTELGAEVTVAACDVSDRDALAALLASVPADHPLTAVVHAAGTLADAPVSALTEEGLDHVLAPKADAARHLHELTRDLPLTAFVLLSSLAGTWGNPGQANYGAANAYLDALAAARRAEGLPGTALAYGLWNAGGMTAHLTEADLRRMGRSGVLPLTDAQGLAAFDAALTADRPAVLSARLDLRALADGDQVHPLLRRLATARPAGRLRRAAARPGAQGALAERLAGLDGPARQELLLGIVRGQVAAVLGFAGPEAVHSDRLFQELGFDSLTALELRNQLNAATGLQLPATLIFDHPTPVALARHLATALLGTATAVTVTRTGGTDADDPIAIVGMACRFPGGVASPEDLWRLVAEGRDGITPFPTDRGWNLDTLFDDDPHRTGTSYCREAGFLHEAGEFDAAFFGISPREALATDPQQRLLLETSWEAVERAGLDPRGLHGSRTGVFAGVMYHDYLPAVGTTPGELEGLIGTGVAGSVASGRIAYTLGLEGPALTVDTACSSSLVALHLAAQALHQGECDLALAGGVTVMATPGAFIDFSRQQGLAPDGRCKSFSTGADGTSWAEGVGMLVLERLSDAQRNGHRVLAVVRGSAINQDGASNGLTAPNGPSQERVIRQALAQAGLSPAEVDTVEAHGTGTSLGDPIEAQALLATYGQEREEPLWLGSLKSNIGHAQAAAGVGGIIKMVMAMRHGVLPRTLHVEEPTTHVDWTAGGVRLLTEQRDWPEVDRPRRAGVSSFGISGTNAHVILEQPLREAEFTPTDPSDPAPWLVSARSPQALRGQAARLTAFLEQQPEAEPEAVAAALAARTAFEYRAVVLGGEELPTALGALAQEASTQGGTAPGLVQGAALTDSPRVGVLFTGQGAQRAGMGRELSERFPVFAAAFDEVCAELDQHLGRSLRELCFDASSDSGELDRTQYTQPALFAFEVAAYRLLESHGLRPAVLVGHSIGELAAAHVAGVLDLSDASHLVAARGRLMQQLPAGGAMIAVQAAEADVLPLLAGHEGRAAVAAVNAPRSTVISGEEETVTAIAGQLAAAGRKTQRLRVSHAFHSPLMDPMLDEFREIAASLHYHEPTIPIVSNLTGEMATSAQLTDPEYWVRHVREAVRFTDGLTAAHALGITTYVETGPDAVLTALTRQILADEEQLTAAPLARRNHPEGRTALEALATLWTRGARIDWAPLVPAAGPVELPTYAFDHQHFWIKPQAATGDLSTAGLNALDHPFLTAVTELATGEQLALSGRLSLTTHPWLADHTVHGTTLVPGTGLAELAIRAGDEAGCPVLEDLTLQAPLVLPEQGGLQVQVTVGAPDAQGLRPVAIHSRPESRAEGEPQEPWTVHADGLLAPATRPAADTDTGADLAAWPPAGAQSVDTADAYPYLVGRGYGYGPVFQGMKAVWRRGEEVFAEVELPEQAHADAARFGLHPALFDAAMHMMLLIGREDGTEQTLLPFSWSGVTLHSAGATTVRVRIAPRGSGGVSIAMADATGAPVLTVGTLGIRPVSAEQLAGAGQASGVLYALDWMPAALAAAEPAANVAVLGTGLADLSGVVRHADWTALTGPAPEHLLAELPAPAPGEAPQRLREASRHALGLVRGFLAQDALADTRLTLVVRTDAAAPSAELAATPDLALAPVRGLIRAAQAEHPGRFALLSTDEESVPLIPAALATEEPELALRQGAMTVPRLVRHTPAPAAELPSLGGTVLITGGTGGLGALVARHLASVHGVRHLVLTSRRGSRAPGAAELALDLAKLGVEVTIAACDVSDRSALAALIAEHPPTAVVHTAGVADNGLVDALTEAQFDRVLAPKADAAWHLHELTRDLPLTAFVLFSSAGGMVLAAGQANYATANLFLDTLAEHRRAEGLPATSLAYGLWDTRTGLSEGLTEADLERMRRQGLPPLTEAQGLAALDAALTAERPVLVPLRVDPAALRHRTDDLPALLRGLRPAGARRTARGGAGTGPVELERRLLGLAGAEREAAVLRFVQEKAAGVLGHASADAVEPERAFQDLGFDSLTAVELRNQLNAATGLRLPATLVFDYPSPVALCAHLLGALAPAPATAPGRGLNAELDAVEASLAARSAAPDTDREAITVRLEQLLADWRKATRPAETEDLAERLEAASAADLLSFIDNELGLS